jgi:hypothetical protein
MFTVKCAINLGHIAMNALKNPITVWVMIILTLSALGWLVAGDPVSQAKWERIEKGMTKEQVVKILGMPDSFDGNQLEYSRFLNAGWVEFAFDEKDVLMWKNDESACGSLQ